MADAAMMQGGMRRQMMTLIEVVQQLGVAVAARNAGMTAEDGAAQTAALLQALAGVKASVDALRGDQSVATALAPFLDGVEGLLAGNGTKLDAMLSALGGKLDVLHADIAAGNVLLEAVRAAVARPNPWNASANGGAVILGTTSTLLKAAAGAGLRNYVTALQVSNLGIGATTVQVLDGPSLIWSQAVPAGVSIGLPVALVGSVNAALNVKLTAAVTLGVTVNAQGYVAA